MANRFQNIYGTSSKKRRSVITGPILSGFLFTGILVLFLMITSSITATGDDQQRESLSKAIDASLLQCYCIEGRYPSDFEYLAKNYGIVYDKSRFRVDYTVFGTNMRPDIFIVDLRNVNE